MLKSIPIPQDDRDAWGMLVIAANFLLARKKGERVVAAVEYAAKIGGMPSPLSAPVAASQAVAARSK